MEVIAFWSYKGGTGRSLTLTNTAYALSRLGKRVTVIDLDVDAPGLVYKFGVRRGDFFGLRRFSDAQMEILARGGLGKLLLQRVIYGVELDEANTPDEVLTVEKIAIPYEFPGGDNAASPVTESNGAIHLIPAGLLSREYWHEQRPRIWDLFSAPGVDVTSTSDLQQFAREVLTGDQQEQLQNLINRLPYVGTENLRYVVEEDKKIVLDEFFDEVVESLKPDYVLLDLSSGINEIQGIALRQWADKVVAFFGHNPEGFDAFTTMRPEIRRLERRDRKPVKVIPVVSRFLPAAYSELGYDLNVFLKEYGLVREELFFLHEDPHLELTDEVALWHRHVQGKFFYHQVCNEYIELIARMLTSADLPSSDLKSWRKENDEHAAALRGVISNINKEFAEYKIFRLYRGLGEIVNLDDRHRNVSFKTDTFCTLLLDLKKLFAKSLKPSDDEQVDGEETADGGAGRAQVDIAEADGESVDSKQVDRAFAQALHEAGLDCGRAFGKEETRERLKDRSLPDRIKEWCAFDTKVGWGHFDADVTQLDKSNSFLLIVKNHFLARERVLHAFLLGYVHGVVSRLVEAEVSAVRISVDREDEDDLELSIDFDQDYRK